MVDFERLVVILNPKSSNAKTAERKVAELGETYPGRVITENIGDTAEDNLNLLNRHLKPGDILVPAGGDGTISHLADHLLRPETPKNLRKAPILLLGTGRMNDIARMLNGEYYNDPEYVLRHGRKLKIYPITCTMTPLNPGGKPHIITALHSIGFGYSAEASKTYNEPGFRARQQKRYLVTREIELFKVSAEILKNAKYFDITYRGRKRKVLDITAANGSYIGKYYRLPSRLDRREFYFAISDDKSFLHTVRTIVELMTNSYSGGRITTRVAFILHKPVLAHIGGETFKTSTPCEVEIAVSKEPLIMITTSR
jgi:diacylglycerol kinase family enzyme